MGGCSGPDDDDDEDDGAGADDDGAAEAPGPAIVRLRTIRIGLLPMSTSRLLIKVANSSKGTSAAAVVADVVVSRARRCGVAVVLWCDDSVCCSSARNSSALSPMVVEMLPGCPHDTLCVVKLLL